MGWFIAIVVIVFIISFIAGGGPAAKAEMDKLDEFIDRGILPENMASLGTYVGGHPSIDDSFKDIKINNEGHQLIIYEWPNLLAPTLLASIPKESITAIDVEDGSTVDQKVTLGRVFLVGIFALAWKKRKKEEVAFVSIIWKDKFEHQTMFCIDGYNAMQNANAERNKLIRMCR